MKPKWILALALLLTTTTQGRSAELRVGRAAVDITPAAGIPMNGPVRPNVPLTTAGPPHDPIHVKAVVLEEGGQRVALVVCDLTSIPLAMIEEARRLVGETTKIAPEAVMISATHCHTVPQIRQRFLVKAGEEVRRKATAYIDALPGKMAEAVRMAEADLKPARASAALGREDSISFNRRFYLKDGSVKTNPFKGDDAKLDQVLRPTGPIDPGVGVVSFVTEAGKPLATMVNFAIHLDTIGGEQPSADLPFVLGQRLAEVQGPELLTVFVPGAAGNINHYDLLNPAGARRIKGPTETSRIGTILAAEVLRTQNQLVPMRSTPLRMAREIVRLDYHPEKAKRLREQIKETPRHFDGEVEVTNEGGKVTFDAEVLAIALGDELAWVGFPGEMFTEFGLTLKNASPFRYTMIHTLANGAIGYVPNRRAYPEGSYEADATRCAPGSGERLVEAATRLLIQLKGDSQAKPN
ncbi:hypothetical protein V5E97_27475 [Singulisphaera sp. Ch08]|uniref:Neutral/alkaline non-lysosomal ceramidase N-terminal domain-containing protein n=1 Tax=Singulisphaera sp. Ch08 TaxID=3120278 RepID=A0AAU7C9G3_9BACT